MFKQFEKPNHLQTCDLSGMYSLSYVHWENALAGKVQSR